MTASSISCKVAVTMCGHAGTVGTLRPVRRLPPRPGWPRTGRRPGQAARTARASRRRRYAPRCPGWCVRAGCTRLRLAAGPGLSAHPEGRPPARRGRRPDLPHRPGRLGRTVRPDRPANRRRPAGTAQRLGANLAFLGYGMLDEQTWVATRAGEEVDGLLNEAGVRLRAVHAPRTPPARRARWAWSAGPGTSTRSAGRTRGSSPSSARCVGAVTARSSDEDAYAARFRLVHAWRTFLFRDPQLPPALLPERWPGTSAAALLRPARDPAAARPPTATSSTASTSACRVRPTEGFRRHRDRAAARRPHRRRRHADPQPPRGDELARRRRSRRRCATPWPTLETDRSCRAVVLAGAGRAFCVGQDLREHVETLRSRRGPTR